MAKSIHDRTCAGCTADVQLALASPLSSAAMVGKSCRAFGSSGSCVAENCVQFLPALLSAHWLHSPLLIVRGPSVCTAHQPCWGACACLTWAGEVGGAGFSQAVARDRVSSCIALCYEINGLHVNVSCSSLHTTGGIWLCRIWGTLQALQKSSLL